MKCPRCGLVHAPGEEVCRRCEIDLNTGVDRPRATCAIATAAAPGLLDRFKALNPRPSASTKKQGPKDEGKTRVAAAQTGSAQTAAVKAKPKSGLIAVMRQPKIGLSLRLQQYRRHNQIAQITCIQCSGPMAVNRKAPFTPMGPIGLLILGGILFVAGFKFHLLWIMVVPAVALGLMYLRVGKTYWKCDSCGMTIPRFSG